MTVILTADGLCRAAAAGSTDDSDGRAGKTDVQVHILENNAEEAKKNRDRAARGRLNAVTALDRSSRAAACRLISRSRCGDRKSSESGGDEGEFELHDEY